MSKAAICFLMNQVILNMGYKKIFFILIITFISTNSFSEIIYKKNNLIITTIDLDKYMELYNNNYGLKIDKNNALKDLVLINNVINYLNKNNKDFLDRIDQEILKQFNLKSLNEINIKNFFRFMKIRDEFIVNYFKNKLVNEEIEITFSKLENLNLPISTNDCLIFEKIVDLKNNSEFINNLLFNLRNNTRDFQITIDGIKYKVCIDEVEFRSIENIIVNYIQTKTDIDFRNFVYDKTKN